jgi:ABC-type maltose transport system permease subunit
MSKSSDAFFRAIFDFSMRNAVPILFWSSLILFVLTFLSMSVTSLFTNGNDQTDRETLAYVIFTALAQGLNNAVWPFTGAALVSVLQQRAEGGAK